MSDRNGKQTRRSVLQAGIAGITGLSATSFAVKGASSKQSDNVNTDFNPNNEEAVEKFLTNFLNLDREVQEQIYQKLDGGQQKVVVQRLSLKKVEVTSTTGTASTEGISTSSTNAYSQTFILTGLAYGGRKIWDYHHKIRYEYDGSGCPIDITNVSHSTWATNIALGWTYDGDVSDETEVVTGGCGGSDEARARAQGKFTYSLDGTFYTANPLSRLAGSTKYDFGISQYVADAWLLEQRCDYCDGIAGN